MERRVIILFRPRQPRESERAGFKKLEIYGHSFSGFGGHFEDFHTRPHRLDVAPRGHSGLQAKSYSIRVDGGFLASGVNQWPTNCAWCRRGADSQAGTLCDKDTWRQGFHQDPRRDRGHRLGQARELEREIEGLNLSQGRKTFETDDDYRARLLGLPGFGPMKAETLVAILGKRLGVTPTGWEAFVPDHMTLGDVDGPESLRRYQDWKRGMKAEKRAAEQA
jgi:hypothetical protein